MSKMSWLLTKFHHRVSRTADSKSSDSTSPEGKAFHNLGIVGSQVVGNGREYRIRTLEPREGLPVFKTGVFNRSTNFPSSVLCNLNNQIKTLESCCVVLKISVEIGFCVTENLR